MELNGLRQLVYLTIVLGLLTTASCKKDEPEPEPSPTDEVEEPVSSFSHVANGATVQFTFDGNNATSFAWDFGDGNTSTDENPIHTYQFYGDYDVQLTVEGEELQDDTTIAISLGGDVLYAIPELDLSNYDGAFYAINQKRLYRVSGSLELVKSGAAMAWVSDAGSNADVGTVSFKQNSYEASLDKDLNDAYAWVEDPDERIGFKRSFGPTWAMQGNVNISSINGLLNPWPIPNTPAVSSSADIQAGSDYAFTLDGTVKDADTICFVLSGPSGEVVKWTSPTSTSITFNGSETSSIGAGEGRAIIAGHKLYEQVLGPRTYQAVNAASTQLTITVE